MTPQVFEKVKKIIHQEFYQNYESDTTKNIPCVVKILHAFIKTNTAKTIEHVRKVFANNEFNNTSESLRDFNVNIHNLVDSKDYTLQAMFRFIIAEQDPISAFNALG